VREQTTLTQLLTLQSFREKVAERSPWPAYLKSHSVEGWGPAAIVASLRGGGGSLDARINGALDPKRVTSAVPAGPNVLQITYDAPSPALAKETLQALVAEYRAERVALPADLLTVYAQQLQHASAAAIAADEKLARYRRRHPGRGGSRTVKKLESAKQVATYQAAQARKALQAASGAASEPDPTVRVIDEATLPAVPTTGRKRLFKGVLAGLFAGLLVSGLGVVALTKGPQLMRGSDAVASDPDFASMSDAELARLIHDMDEEWATANDDPPNELLGRRSSSRPDGGHDVHGR
jgi:hypothetical protein